MPNRQLFGFLVLSRNPTDINNSVARAELQVTYVLQNDVNAVCRIPHKPELADNTSAGASGTSTVFSLPLRIDAHQTTSGLLLFPLENEVIGSGSVDSHSLILEDTHGISTTSEPITVTEWTDAPNTDEAKEERNSSSTLRESSS